MSEFYFDSRDGSLLVGAEAIDPRLEEAGPAVIPLRDLLEMADFPFTPQDFDKRLYEQWSHEELAQLGSWALNIIKTDENPRPILARRHLERLYILGLGPNIRRQHAITTMRALRLAADSPEGHDPGLYDEWSARDFARYALQLSQKLGRRPRKEDYTAAAGPSARIIHRRFGGVGELNEMIGYPNVRAWQPEDYIQWGSQVMRANPHRPFNYFLIEDLSRLDRGPSEYPIYRRFGTIGNFRELVQAEYDRQQAARSKQKSDILARYQKLKTQTAVPAENEFASEDQLLQFVGKFELAKNCILSRSDRHELALQLAELPLTDMTKKLYRYNQTLRSADIETQAVILGVQEFLWPDESPEQHYRVA